MGWDGYLTIALVLAVLGFLALSRIAPDFILLAALIVLMTAGVLTPDEAFSGFSNTGLMTIAALYVVAAGLRATGAIQMVTRQALGQPRTVRGALFRMLAPTASLSAFLNNTTVVAMLIPSIQDWSQRLGISPSKLLLPLSYAAILGGTLTLIGTSTNLVVNGLLVESGEASLGMFDITFVGLTVLAVGGGFLLLFGDRLLPNSAGASASLDRVREYHVEMKVSGTALAGKTLAVSGLNNLSHGYLYQISRDGLASPRPGAEFELHEGDQLSFIGSPQCAHELRSMQGLLPAHDDVSKLQMACIQRSLVEVVIGPEFPFLGMTLAECDFIGAYQAIVLSVSRGNDSQIAQRSLQTPIRVGDTLLLETSKEFTKQYVFRKDFLLVSELENSSPPDFSKARTALAIASAMVLVSAFNVLPILTAAWLGAGLMLLTGCLNAGLAQRAIDFSVLTVIGASFALGQAMTETGAAQFIAGSLLEGHNLSPIALLFIVYALTSLFTEVITNNAAAVLMFPICAAIAEQMGISVVPFAIAIMFAASASFMTPIGYQTNLMVYGPGGYRFADYLRLGIPMNVLTALAAVPMINWIWPL